MADYFPLIARAVSGLENSTAQAQGALYERARTALITQLRTVDPPLEEADIMRERIALENAIRRVELQSAVKIEAFATVGEPPRHALEDEMVEFLGEAAATGERPVAGDKPRKIFISYRRDDSAGHAGRVHDRLVAEFGQDHLFMDVDGIPLGSDFVTVLKEEVAQCDVLCAHRSSLAECS
jgi:hypothetical protein